MIALWMIYTTSIAAIIGTAAACIDRAVGTTIGQRRWIWLAAVLLSIGIPLTVVLTPSRDDSALGTSDGFATLGRTKLPALEGSVLANRIADLIATADSRSLERFDRPFAIGWAIAVVLAVGAYGAATWSLVLRRRSWRAAVVEGEPVLLARGVGPAVIGAVRTAIVVPEWSLDLAPEQRALMIEHERQHVRARDPLVLHTAALAALLAPWNLPLWWMNRRLRLAVELDCDARVLAGSRDVRAYGTLLLDVCSRRGRTGALLAPALLERTSSLTKRILAMHPVPVRYARSRIALGAAVALGIVAIACEMPTPEMLAPDGKDAASKRLYGKLAAAAMPLDGVDNTRKVIDRYFPKVAAGSGEPAVLFVVRSATGEIVMTEAQAASRLMRMPAGARIPADGAEAGPATREQPPGESRVKVRSSTGAGLPTGIGAIRPNEIEAIDVTKHAAGVVAPKAVSLIVISLKIGAAVPTPAQ